MVPLFLLTVEVEPEDRVVILVFVEPELRTLLLVVLETPALRLLDELVALLDVPAVVVLDVDEAEDDDADLRAFELAAEGAVVVVVVVPALERDWMSRALVTRLPFAAAGISAVLVVNDLSGCCWP